MRHSPSLTKSCNCFAFGGICVQTLVCSFSFLFLSNYCEADDGSSSKGQRLSFVESVENPDLVGVNRLVLTSNDKFLYAASWRGDNLSIFSRDTQGKLTHLNTLKTPMLKGAIKLVFNRDESQLAVICMRSSTILLFARDTETGKLKPDGFGKAEMVWPVSLSFSPKGDFLYVGDAGGNSTSQAKSAIAVFRVEEKGALKHVRNFEFPDMNGMRNVRLSPDGRNVYGICSSSRCIFAFRRDEETGELELLQRIVDGDSGIALLHGVHSAWVSADGKRVYTIAGRFEGTNGVTVFDRGEEGKLSPLYNCEIGAGFGGGNDIQLTADERTVIVSGTTGNSLAILDNDFQKRKMTLRQLIPGDEKILLNGPSGLTFDSQQKFLHVAVENASALTTFALIQADE